MGAHSWAENLKPLLGHFRIYSIDNIGEGNKSELRDPLVYPETQEEIADHFAEIMDALRIDRAPLFGASNGGFIASCYTSYYPERVESLSLFGPMGLTPLTGRSYMMLSIATMYPLQCIRDRVSVWALGKDPGVHAAYGDWFNCIMKSTIPSVGRPVPMSTEQKTEMNLPILLFLGTEDPIVGDAEQAKVSAEEYPNIRIEVLESGHLIATEHASYVNSVLVDFLDID
jgi:pimeloyl-ACP methyl ester carboxylesterase